MDLLDVVNENFDCDELVTMDELWAKFHADPPKPIVPPEGWDCPPGLENIKHPSVIGIDSESEHYHWFKPHVNAFCLTISWAKEHTYYVAVPKDDLAEMSRYLQFVHGLLVSGHLIIFHNAKYDLHVLHKMFKKVGRSIEEFLDWTKIHDTMLMSHCLDENRAHKLKDLSDFYKISYSEADASELQNQIKGWIQETKEFTGTEPSYADVPSYLMVPYAVQDAYITLALFVEFYFQILSDPKKEQLLQIYAMERELMRVLWKAEERGVRIDLDFVYKKISELQPQVNILIEECKILTENVDFNPLSVDDVAQALKKFDLFDSSTMINPTTKKVNLPEWALEKIDHPIINKVLECRLSTKLLTSYFQAIIDYHRIDDGGQALVSCNFMQIGARTGRMSVTDPALQTLPKTKGNVRGAFISREGHKWILADYSSQELRILAHYTLKEDPGIAQAVLHGDLHQEAADALGVERKKAKGFNFAIVYGAGQKKLAEMLGVSLQEGKGMLKQYHRRFPGINWLKYLAESVTERRGYVETAYGRRHRLVRYWNKDGTPKTVPWDKSKQQTNAYKAINSLIQGTAADMAKSAMIKVAKAFEAEGMQSMILLQIHDEIIVEAPDHELERAMEIMEQQMTDCPEMSVPMAVEMEVAVRWGEKEEEGEVYAYSRG